MDSFHFVWGHPLPPLDLYIHGYTDVGWLQGKFIADWKCMLCKNVFPFTPNQANYFCLIEYITITLSSGV